MTTERTAEIETFLWKHIDRITGGEKFPYLTADHIIRDVVRTCELNEAVAKCSLPSIGTAARQAFFCQLSVDPLLGLAALIPRKGTCHFERMYKGMLDLAYRSEKVLVIRAYTVYEGDDFDCDLGTSAFIRYKPNQHATEKDRIWEAVKCAYAIAELAGGAKLPDIVWRPELEEIRDKALQLNTSPDNPWRSWHDAMCKKTPAKRVCSYVPQNPFLAYALGLEGLEEAGKLAPVDPAFAGVTDKPIPTDTTGLAKRVGEGITDMDKKPAPDPDMPMRLEATKLRMRLLGMAQNAKVEMKLRDLLDNVQGPLSPALETLSIDKLVTLKETLEEGK